MNSMEASTLLATIIGLICNWKQERGAQATDRYQDFMKWLVQHNFNDLKERIYQSEELQRDLTALLQQDLTVINDKLDIITGSISAVADKIDFLSQTSRSLGNTSEVLSEQACLMMLIFDKTQAARMIYSPFMKSCVFDHLPHYFEEIRFIESDIDQLLNLNFIKFSGYNNQGDAIYNITRNGSEFAKNLTQTSS